MNDEKKINTLRPLQGAGRKLFVETYGCQMNVGDTEIVVAIMQQEGYVYTDKIEEADVVLINTCSIRDNAEQRIWGRLREMAHLRRRRPGLLVGIIGCMAERLRERLLEGENPVDIVAGPDAYRDLPRLVREAGEGGRGVNVLLSREETYAEIAPVRLDLYKRQARSQRREQLYRHHARVQQLLFVLRGALYAGRGAQPRSADYSERSPQPVRERLPGGDAVGTERQFVSLWSGRFSAAICPIARLRPT